MSGALIFNPKGYMMIQGPINIPSKLRLKHTGHFAGRLLTDNASFAPTWIAGNNNIAYFHYAIEITVADKRVHGKIISDYIPVSNSKKRDGQDYDQWFHDAVMQYEKSLKMDGIPVVQTSMFECRSSYEHKLRFLDCVWFNKSELQNECCLKTAMWEDRLQVICLGLLPLGFKAEVGEQHE